MLRVAALCDVNVLLALVADRHALHGLAVRWAESVPAGGAAISAARQSICRAVRPVPRTPRLKP